MKLIVLIPKEDYLDINLSVLLTSENTSCLLLGNLVQTCLRNRMKSCREETQTHLMKTIKICLFSTVKAEIFELCVMLTYLWQLTPSVHFTHNSFKAVVIIMKSCSPPFSPFCLQTIQWAQSFTLILFDSSVASHQRRQGSRLRSHLHKG